MTTRTIHKLTDKAIKAAKPGKRLHDGDGLYLRTDADGKQAWESRYEHLTIKGKRRTMGQGSYPAVSREDARALHKEAKALVRAGVDPIARREANIQTTAASLTVMEAAEAYIAAMEADWQTKRYPAQIRERFSTYVKPVIGDMAISDIEHAEAMLVLQPIWNTIRPTAKRIRQHLERTVDMAITGGHRKNVVNPFEVKRLRGALPFAKRTSTNFIALPPAQAPGFLAELRAQPKSVKTLALEFVILNTVRVADICGGGKEHSEPMKWSHVDLDAALWTVPDTKMGRPHVVPLSNAALAVLVQMRRYRDPTTDYVFPGAVKGTVIADSTLRYLIADMGYKELATTHGFRATFKTWAEDETSGHDPFVIEAALAHAKKGMTAIYHRGSYLDKRRRLMAEWAAFLEGKAEAAGTVVPLRA